MLERQLVAREGLKITTNPKLIFPEGFLWGAATSAFQVEGNPKEMQGRSSDWAYWSILDGKIEDGTTADNASEFYARYRQDIELCKTLNLNAFRISLNWAALRPNPTASREFSLDAGMIAYYRKLLRALKSAGMTTFVTLFHFCLPRWLAELGGWNSHRTVEEFEKYAGAAARELGSLVDYWITINEPMVYAYKGYIDGTWPPGEDKHYAKGFHAVRHMLEGHALAYTAIRESDASGRVSFANHWRPFFAKNKLNPLDLMVRYIRDETFNHLFPRAIETGELTFPFPVSQQKGIKELSGPIDGLKGAIDFLAFNYYGRETCQFKYSWPIDFLGERTPPLKAEMQGLFWDYDPEGLFYLLTEDLKPYEYDQQGVARPIFITENGHASAFSPKSDCGDWSLDDPERIKYLVSHLVAVHESIHNGANVKGYLHWSLIDNFEWSQGLTARFGLVRVAYPTQERKKRKSADVYAAIATKNELDSTLIELATDGKYRK